MKELSQLATGENIQRFEDKGNSLMNDKLLPLKNLNKNYSFHPYSFILEFPFYSTQKGICFTIQFYQSILLNAIYPLSYNNKNLRMNRLFGAAKKQEPAPPKKQEPKPAEEPPKKVTIPLSEQQAKLQNKIREISETVTRLDNQAKELLQKSKKAKGSAKEMYKQRCVNVLRKRKQYDNQLKNYMNQQFTLDQVGFTSQSIQNTIQMAATMKEVVEQQKTIMKDLDIDKLDDIRDEMDELKYESDYMNEMLNRDYDVDIDEDDLDDQLGELERELKAEKNVAKKKEVNQQQQINKL